MSKFKYDLKLTTQNRNIKNILFKISLKRFYRNQLSKKKKKYRRVLKQKSFSQNSKPITTILSNDELLRKYLPPNIKFLIFDSNSEFNLENLKRVRLSGNGVFLVPSKFSVLENPLESYKFLIEVLSSLIFQKFNRVIIDYSVCFDLDLSTQVLLDIILIEIIKFYTKIRQVNNFYAKTIEIAGTGYNDINIKKMLLSVGSPAIHTKNTISFEDVVPYKICIHERGGSRDIIKSERKDIDTTTLVDYVLDCLGRMNKKLTPEKRDDLCIVISEILINAEEHSSTNFRFSIGYFNEIKEDGKHFGVFRLAILNFGKTIYEKFSDPDCPNFEIVSKMRELSKSYTNRDFFNSKSFEQETLWTLYSLQEGVTSVPYDHYRKRGNGSIRFIESFFNLKGDDTQLDKVSKMTILSGNASIVFDGEYKIFDKELNGDSFKFMTFNKSQNIEDKPDPKYVKFVENFFPGTIISAKILFHDDDFAK